MTSPLLAYLQVLRRRVWYVVGFAILTPAAAAAVAFAQPVRYQATAKVLLTTQDIAAVTGEALPQAAQDPVRVADTQLQIARVPQLAARVLGAAGETGMTPDDFLHASHVSAAPTADILDFSVRDASTIRAQRLATAYAQQFIQYKRELGATAYTRAAAGVSRRLQELKRAGQGTSKLYETLLERREQLRTLATLDPEDAVLLRPATDTNRVQPRPVRAAVIGGLLGLLLGIAAAGVAEAVDTRTRSTAEVSDVLGGLPLLGRVPTPAVRRRHGARLPMAEQGAGVDAEAYRNVRANLDLLLRKTGYRKILVTSALSVEGKSTTIANLAIALALAGRHVVAVDFDLRRPSLGELFELERSPGVSDLLLGTAAFDSCLVSVPLEAQPSLDRSEIGSLRVMAAGSPTLNPGELVGGRGAAELLNQLSGIADVVLVDTAPALHVSDATALLDAVDAVLLVVRSTLATYDQLQELGQLLSHAPAEPLGFVLTGTPRARTGAHEYLTRYEA